MSLKIGQTIGHYRIVDQLGAGGMGIVYKAQDVGLGRLVALKVLPKTTAEDQEAMERFRREARTASSLNHPNICTIYSFSEQDGQMLLAMELLEGDTLAKKLGGKPLDLQSLLDVGHQIAEALDAAHGEGVLHRDIKPANIFVTRRGQVKVLDFGLAKLATAGHDVFQTGAHPTEQFTSMAGTTVGTIAYMSPEQARGESLDPRTDLFSFGVVLYEMSTGLQSFMGATTAVIFDRILNRDPAPPSAVNATIPAELDRIISKALEKDRAFRYQSAADMRADLQRLKRDSGSRRMPVLPALDAAATIAVNPSNSARSAVGAPGATGLSGSASSVAPGSSSSAARVQLPPSTTGSAANVPPMSAAGTAVAPGASTPAKTRLSPLMLAVAGLVGLGLAAILAEVWIRTRSADSDSVSQQAAASTPPVDSAAPPDPAPITPASSNATPTADLAPPAPVAPPPPVPPAAPAAVPATAKPPAPGPASGNASATAASKPPVPGNRTGTVAVAPPPGKLPPTNETTAAPITAATGTTSPRTTDAGQRLIGIRAKIGNNQLDSALGDLRQLVIDFPGTPAAVEASFMSAEVLEKLGRIDEAMAAHVEFLKRHNSDSRAPASRLRLAELTARAGRGDRENDARRMLADIAAAYPRTAYSQAALQMKLRLEQGKRQRERDPVLGMEVPIILPTLRAMAEQFPGTPMAMQALGRLGELYLDLDQWERAAQSYIDLGTAFPNNTNDAWFRAAEILERRLKDMPRALDAYGKVPPNSPRYRDAQRKLTQK